MWCFRHFNIVKVREVRRLSAHFDVVPIDLSTTLFNVTHYDLTRSSSYVDELLNVSMTQKQKLLEDFLCRSDITSCIVVIQGYTEPIA